MLFPNPFRLSCGWSEKYDAFRFSRSFSCGRVSSKTNWSTSCRWWLRPWTWRAWTRTRTNRILDASVTSSTPICCCQPSENTTRSPKKSRIRIWSSLDFNTYLLQLPLHLGHSRPPLSHPLCPSGFSNQQYFSATFVSTTSLGPTAFNFFLANTSFVKTAWKTTSPFKSRMEASVASLVQRTNAPA